VTDAAYTFKLPEAYGDIDAAPLLCAGLIGFRAYRMAGEGRRLGIYGFGAAAHIIAQIALHDRRDVYAFTSPGDAEAQAFARSLGVTWAGGSDGRPPELLDAAIIFAPVGALVPQALSHVVAGGTVVCAGIHMSDVPSFPYRLLWQERVVRSVANLTRQDARDFLEVAAHVPIKVRTARYDLADANRALSDLRAGRLSGAAVLVPAV
jgi:propanol-preferring alcohol dehydrogenase